MNPSQEIISPEQIRRDVQQLTRREKQALLAWLEGLLKRDEKPDKIQMRDGDAILIMVKGGKVIHHTSNMSLPHSEFVKRATGQLPEGAWVGTVSKLDGEIAAITSKHFFGYQLPAPPGVVEAVRSTFE